MVSRSSDPPALKSWGAADPLSAALLDLRSSGTFLSHNEFRAPWAVELPQRGFATFHFVAAGACWLRFPKGTRLDSVRVEAGDLALLPRSPSHVFGFDRRTKGVPVDELPEIKLTESTSMVSYGGEGERSLIVCGGVRFDGFMATTLVSLLPELLVLRRSHGGPIVAATLEAMERESLDARPGGLTLMRRFAEIVVVSAIRSWLEDCDPKPGWLAAIGDPQIGRTMAAVHQRPGDDWSVATMARLAHLSRSRFAQRFTEMIGVAPMQYLTQVRMHDARERLRTTTSTVAEMSHELGYESAPSFTRAFKRYWGVAPGVARRAA